MIPRPSENVTREQEINLDDVGPGFIDNPEESQQEFLEPDPPNQSSDVLLDGARKQGIICLGNICNQCLGVGPKPHSHLPQIVEHVWPLSQDIIEADPGDVVDQGRVDD